MVGYTLAVGIVVGVYIWWTRTGVRKTLTVDKAPTVQEPTQLTELHWCTECGTVYGHTPYHGLACHRCKRTLVPMPTDVMYS